MTVSSGSYTVRISSNDPRTDYGIFPGNPPTTRISRDGNIMITFNDEPEAPKFTFFNSSGNEVGYSYAPSGDRECMWDVSMDGKSMIYCRYIAD